MPVDTKDLKDFDQLGDKDMDFKIRRNEFSHLQNLVAVNVERSKSDLLFFCNFFFQRPGQIKEILLF